MADQRYYNRQQTSHLSNSLITIQADVEHWRQRALRAERMVDSLSATISDLNSRTLVAQPSYRELVETFPEPTQPPRPAPPPPPTKKEKAKVWLTPDKLILAGLVVAVGTLLVEIFK